MTRYVVIDLETTGHAPESDDKIIEIGMVVIKDDMITERYSSLLNPNKPIPPFISRLTGIYDADVRGQPEFSEIAPQIAENCKDCFLIAHNVAFDLGFLNQEFAANGMKKLENPVIDTVELARILYPSAPAFKLEQLADYLNIEHDAPHRALSDAVVTAKLFLLMKQKINQLPYETIHHLLRLHKSLKSDISHILHANYNAKAFAYNTPKNIDTFHGLAFKTFDVEKQEDSCVHLSYGDYLDNIYEENGALKRALKHYEKRPGQRCMSEIIYDAFQSRSHALIEAETGTGKSLSYLVAAVYESLKSKKRVVISTHTTQLQSQLLNEEIPLVQKLLSQPIRAAVLKGKKHYISLEKFAHALTTSEQENYDIVLTKAILLVWLTETETGDIDEIQLPASGYMFYNNISAEAEREIDPTSPWFSRSYYQKARKRASQANIVITNHALLCADMFNDYKLIPAYDKAIIDEAHHLEETVSKYYGLKLDYASLRYFLNQMDAGEDSWLTSIFSRYPQVIEIATKDEWNQHIVSAKHEIDDLFHAIFQYVSNQNQSKKSLSDIGKIQYRFDGAKEMAEKWQSIKEMAARAMLLFRDLKQILTQFKQTVETYNIYDKFDLDDIGNQIENCQSFLDRIEGLFLSEDSGKEVKWIEIETAGTKNSVYLYSEPIDVSTLLSETFFDRKESVVLTSATLTIDRSFTFIANRLGLTNKRLMTKKIQSPFSYKNQVQLMVPNDFPDIKKASTDEFVYATCEAICSLADITKGRMLVLFTSYDMLRKVYDLLRETLDTVYYTLIAQGVSSGSRAKLKKNFQTFDRSILLGTSSFWEGIDIPGEDLSCLVIVRLPFEPPNHPIYEAKANALKKDGKNPFMELALPNAIIRFKQGFGRLIRSSSDRGIVFICDSRIKKARYGKSFIQSIPEVPVFFASTQTLMSKAAEWF